MLQETYARLGFLKPEDIYVSTQKIYAPLVRKQLPHLKPRQLILESAARDTGPSICYSAHVLATHGHEREIMMIAYADCSIENSRAFQAAVKATVSYAEEKNMFGVVCVKALWANTALGYIQIGKLLQEKITSGVKFQLFELAGFVEKPNLETAQKFVDSYRYFWNTGLYVGRVSFILDTFKRRSGEIYMNVIQNKYEKAPKISIDFALIEKLPAGSMFAVPADLGWDDIGTWNALWLKRSGPQANMVLGASHSGLSTRGCLIYGQKGKTVATIDIENLVIIDTPEALLIVPRDKASKVKEVDGMIRPE